jgi:hypothetical protein
MSQEDADAWKATAADSFKSISDFQSGHFSEPNIIGHMMSSMNKHEGKNAFTLDQIQSDWGQKLGDDGRNAIAQKLFGRSFDSLSREERPAVSAEISAMAARGDRPAGVRDEAKIAELKAALDDADQAYRDVPLTDVAGANSRMADLRRLEAEYATARASASGHPLVNTTDQWTNTTLRRGLQQAIEANADYMAIPSGKTVLGYNPGDTHGMTEFYDKIVPKNLANILAKLDKAGVQRQFVPQLQTPSGMKGDGFTVFNITPAMREQARQGLPLFQNPATGAIAPLSGNAFEERR